QPPQPHRAACARRRAYPAMSRFGLAGRVGLLVRLYLPLATLPCIKDPASRQTELKVGEAKYDQEEQPREGRGIAHIKADEGILIDVQGDKPGRARRAAVGGNEGDFKGAQGKDDPQDQVEEDGR